MRVIDGNEDIVTWLGDIASSSGDFIFAYFRNKKKEISIEQQQDYINMDAPGSDMLGDIEPYVIATYYKVGAEQGRRVTDIFYDYFIGTIENPPKRNYRCSVFCNEVGLKGWNGTNFSNEKEWIKYYSKQLRDNTCFQVFSLTNEKIQSAILPALIWIGFYKKITKFDMLLQIFLNALKKEIKGETLTNQTRSTIFETELKTI